MRLLLLPVLAAILALSGSASAGMYQPPPSDYSPQWVSNGLLAFEGYDPQTAGQVLKTVNADGPPQEQVIVPDVVSYAGVLAAPTAPLLAFAVEHAGSSWLAAAAPDGSQLRLLFDGGVPVAWLRNSSRLIFSDSPGMPRLYSIRPDGTDLQEYPATVHGVPSPDGTRFAYATNGAPATVHVVHADGSGDKRLTSGNDFTETGPVWSPDGSQLAFLRNSDGRVSNVVVARIGAAARTLTVVDAHVRAIGGLYWAPDGRTLFVGALLAGLSADHQQDMVAPTRAGSYGYGLVGIDLATGKHRTLVGITQAVFSPDGTRTAYTAGGECRTRRGIYVANADGSGRRRLSNNCRIVGTLGPDVLHGGYSQVVLGLEGDDTLYAGSGYAFFEGDTLYGGPGNDRLVGGYARDTLYGGPGDDVILGGLGADILVGGPGHDHLYGQGGGDTIGARDGQRDWISCGKNSYGKAGRDVVYADRLDVVSRDCEVVHRH